MRRCVCLFVAKIVNQTDEVITMVSTITFPPPFDPKHPLYAKIDKKIENMKRRCQKRLARCSDEKEV